MAISRLARTAVAASGLAALAAVVIWFGILPRAPEPRRTPPGGETSAGRGADSMTPEAQPARCRDAASSRCRDRAPSRDPSGRALQSGSGSRPSACGRSAGRRRPRGAGRALVRRRSGRADGRERDRRTGGPGRDRRTPPERQEPCPSRERRLRPLRLRAAALPAGRARGDPAVDRARRHPHPVAIEHHRRHRREEGHKAAHRA